MVGDHGTHFRRREVLPSEEYVVPALFLAPGRIAAARIDAVTSQLDLAPTILGLVGGSFRSPFFGRDVLATGEPEGFAPLVYKKRVYGVRRADRLTVLGGAGRPSVAYRVRPDSTTVPTAMSPAHREDELDLLALLSVADQMLRARHYTDLPLPPGPRAGRAVSSAV